MFFRLTHREKEPEKENKLRGPQRKTNYFMNTIQKNTKKYASITSAQDLRQATGSWASLNDFLLDMPNSRTFQKEVIHLYAKQLLEKLTDKQLSSSSISEYRGLTRLINEVKLGRKIAALETKEANPKIMGISVNQLAQAEPVVYEMGEKVEANAKVENKSEPKTTPIRVKKSSKPATDIEKLPPSKNSLFKVYLEYAPQEGYEKGFEGYFNSEDLPHERKYFAHKGHLRMVERLLSEGYHPNDIFGYGSMAGGDKGIKGWNYNYNRIQKFAKNGHPHSGRLIKAYIFFRPLIDHKNSPLCLFSYKDEEYYLAQQQASHED